MLCCVVLLSARAAHTWSCEVPVAWAVVCGGCAGQKQAWLQAWMQQSCSFVLEQRQAATAPVARRDLACNAGQHDAVLCYAGVRYAVLWLQ